MHPPHDQARLPRQVDSHRGQDRLLPAVRQQRRVAGHFALPLPARQKLRVGRGVQSTFDIVLTQQHGGVNTHGVC